LRRGPERGERGSRRPGQSSQSHIADGLVHRQDRVCHRQQPRHGDPIRTATNKALNPVKVGLDPEAIAITPDGGTAYAVDLAGGMETPIRTVTNKALKPIKVGSYPRAIAITP
jgi:DNA-binding beta-propeller fold protein YncE